MVGSRRRDNTEGGGNMCGKTGSTNSKMQSAKTECACETARRHGPAAVKAAGNPYVEVSFERNSRVTEATC